MVLRENHENRHTFIPTKQKAERDIYINNIRNEKEDITTDTEEIQRIIRSYFIKPVLQKLGKLKGNGQLSGWISLTKIKSRPEKQINRPITAKEIETGIKILPNKKKF